MIVSRLHIGRARSGNYPLGVCVALLATTASSNFALSATIDRRSTYPNANCIVHPPKVCAHAAGKLSTSLH